MRLLVSFIPKPSVRLPLVAVSAVLLAVLASSVMHAGQDSGIEAALTVWDGVYTEEQAERGRVAYIANCAECHGEDLGGGEGTALAGDIFWDEWRELTVDRLFDFVSTNMPFDDLRLLAGTLSTRTYIDVVAFILSRNALPMGETELTPASSIGIQIIAKDGPGELPNSTLAYVVGCLAEGLNGGWEFIRGSRAVRPESVGAGEADQPLGDRVYQLMFLLMPLDDYVGYRMSATGLLIGEGGVDGLNVSTVEPISETCE